MGEKRLYVAYGSNMNAEQMSRRCPGAQLVEVGNLVGYKLTFAGHGFANIEKCEGSEVPVALWELKYGHIKALDAYEGYPRHYVKRNVEVECYSDGEYYVDGFVYVMNSKLAAVPCTPSIRYFKGIFDAYSGLGLDCAKLCEARWIASELHTKDLLLEVQKYG